MPGYTLYWKGVETGRKHERGVGIAISTKLNTYIVEKPIGINDRIMYMKLRFPNCQEITVVSVYVPTLKSTDEEQFYAELQTVLNKTYTKSNIIILGDFNARVGQNVELRKDVIGQLGIGEENENGERLLR